MQVNKSTQNRRGTLERKEYAAVFPPKHRQTFILQFDLSLVEGN